MGQFGQQVHFLLEYLKHFLGYKKCYETCDYIFSTMPNYGFFFLLQQCKFCILTSTHSLNYVYIHGFTYTDFTFEHAWYNFLGNSE
jgi:hypothetical protein